MALALGEFERKAQEATMAFWGHSEQVRSKQVKAGKADRWEGARVSESERMEGFAQLAVAIIKQNGPKSVEVYRKGLEAKLPGYFRPAKRWDILVRNRGRLVAAIDFKAQTGPSFKNKFMKASEEAVGTAHDFLRAYREGAFGDHAKPYLACFLMVEDTPGSRLPLCDESPQFPVASGIQGSCYLHRYKLLGKKLMQERLYDAATIISSSRDAMATGRYEDHSEITSLKSFVVSLAAYAAAEAAR